MREGNNRRDVLKLALWIWGIIVSAPIAGMVLQFLTPRRADSHRQESIAVAKASDIQPGSTRIVRFNKEPVIVIHTPSGQFKAFSARCTHLGCVVQIQDDGEAKFSCNCHGSRFDGNGRNISGPAPRPLPPFKVRLEHESILLTRV